MRPELRQYQRDAIHNLRLGWVEGHKRQVLVAPTAAGKSVCAHEIVAAAHLKGKRVWFLVNRIQLVQQFSERLTAAGIDHGILRGEETEREWHPVLVGSVQTAVRRRVEGDPDVIVLDEAHAVPGSSQYRKLLAKYPQAAILGLTATPWSKGMGRHCDEVGGVLFQNSVVAASYSELIAGGHLVPFEVWAPELVDLAGVKTVRNSFGEQDYQDQAVAEKMNKPKLVGDIVAHWMRLARDKKTVVFACDIKHSMAIVEAFKHAGVNAEHIDCYCDVDERKEILKRVDDGQTTVVSCVALLSEGWDQPSIECMILARPTKSMVRYIQMCGRVMRPYPGKTKALLIDHTGSVLRLGFPDDDQDYTLDGHKPAKQAAKKEKEPKRCVKCGYIDHYKGLIDDPSCPNCGHVPEKRARPVVAADGVLAQVKRTQATPEDKQLFWAELLFIAHEKRKSRGWASHTYRAKFGVWPRGLRDFTTEPRMSTRSFITHRNIAYAKSRAAENVGAR